MQRRTLTIATMLGLALASSAGVSSYTLRRGDSLSVVANRAGVTVADLAKLNGIRRPDRVVAGQVIRLPESPAKKAAPSKIAPSKAGPAKTAKAAATKAAALPSVYVVAQGDTLSTIAARLGVSMTTLAAANRITNHDVVYLGQRITVPGGVVPAPAPVALVPAAATLAMVPISAVKILEPGVAPTAVVAAGDTASKIAARQRITVAALRKANPGRSLDHLTAGTVLHLPGPPVWLCPVQGVRSFVDTWGAPRENGTWHQGTDVFAARGTPVVASVGGTLELRHGAVGGNAYYLHGDDGTKYYGAHLDAVTAAAGRIEAGQQIGIVGDTGDAKGTPTHLHFEIHPNEGGPVDSYFTLDKWC